MKFIPELDFYSFLGLEDFASLEVVKVKYRELAKIHHPDRGGDVEKMKRINHIYDVMKEGKAHYDNWLRKQLAPAVQERFAYPHWTDAWTSNATDVGFTFGGF